MVLTDFGGKSLGCPLCIMGYPLKFSFHQKKFEAVSSCLEGVMSFLVQVRRLHVAEFWGFFCSVLEGSGVAFLHLWIALAVL